MQMRVLKTPGAEGERQKGDMLMRVLKTPWCSMYCRNRENWRGMAAGRGVELGVMWVVLKCCEWMSRRGVSHGSCKQIDPTHKEQLMRRDWCRYLLHEQRTPLEVASEPGWARRKA